MKISVIVPCYNVEEYIKKGLDSLINQTLKDIEIILINDGSKDKTIDILKEYDKKDKRIVIIDKKNEGVSKARNDGLEKATGEYIAFMDSDDWFELDALEKMYNKAKDNDFDIVACDTYAIYPDRKQYIKSAIKDNQTNKKLMIDAYAVIWNKIYKKEILKNIKFNTSLTFCEDVLFLYQIYERVNKIGSINEPLYNYLQRQNSLTYTYDKKLYQLIESQDEIINYYKKGNIFAKYKEELEYTYVRYLFATFIKRLAKTKNKKEFKTGYKYVKEKVKEEFPNYKKNKYLNNKKGMYLKNFNYALALIIYNLEKNKMN